MTQQTEQVAKDKKMAATRRWERTDDFVNFFFLELPREKKWMVLHLLSPTHSLMGV